jgi:hypothetical protein
MAVITPPIGVQSGSHSAKSFRQLSSALAGHDVTTFVGGVSAFGTGHGIVRPGHLAVSQNGTPNMSVNVAAGSALVTGTSSLAQGVYVVTNDATVNLAIATADATNPRRDLVIAQVRDNTEDASGSNDFRLFVVTGTPAASPSDPAVPAGSVVLARVTVGAGVTSIVNANITDLRILARGSAWNQAWGEVAYAEITSNSASFTAIADVSGLSAAFTAIAGRKYRTTFNGDVASTVAGDVILITVADAANAGKARATGRLGATSVSETFHTEVREATLSGATTRKIRAERVSGSGTCTIQAGATFPAFVLVEDIGPA